MSNKYKASDKVVYENEIFTVTRAFGDGDLSLKRSNGKEYPRYVNQALVRKYNQNSTAKTLMHSITKGIVKAKLHMPKGVTLNNNEAQIVIDEWEEEKKAVVKQQDMLMKASDNIESYLTQNKQEIPAAIRDLKEARKNFKVSKTKIAKARWARKILVRNGYYEQLRRSNLALNSTIERIKDSVDDANYIHKTISSRISEANIYRELNNGLQLVGRSLQEARTRHSLPDVEYTKLEANIEAIESIVQQKDDDTVLRDAEAIVNDTERWSEFDEIKKNDNTPKAAKRSKAES